MSSNNEINLVFNHENLKKEMIRLLNQYEHVDEFYRDNIEFGKPEHSRNLRKIYNKMLVILENNYKNLPKELEKYNKTVPKEDKQKIIKTSKNNTNLKGGNNQHYNNNNDENIINNNNDNEENIIYDEIKYLKK